MSASDNNLHPPPSPEELPINNSSFHHPIQTTTNNNNNDTTTTQLVQVPSITRNVTAPHDTTEDTENGATKGQTMSFHGGGITAPLTRTTTTTTNKFPPATSATTTSIMTHPPIPQLPSKCLNPATDINSRLDTQVEVRVYPCNNNNNNNTNPPKKKFTQFHVKPEGVIIQGTNRHHNNRISQIDLGTEYAMHIGRKLQRYELSDTRACQLLVTTHNKSFWVVPAPEAFSRHSGTCRLLGDRKHNAAVHTLQVGDFLRVGSVGVVVIETHDGNENRVLSEEKIQKIMKDTTSNSGGFLDLVETEGGEYNILCTWYINIIYSLGVCSFWLFGLCSRGLTGGLIHLSLSLSCNIQHLFFPSL